ncbi:MAG TPA: hypothetical protein VGN97_12505 [Mesorhizobium sp.]|nr:hypothetical protein [Mesorhizobium sp.]
MVGMNLPYGISRDEDYALPVHGTDRFYPALLIEVRNDELGDGWRIRRWADRLATALAPSVPEFSS